jgi:hypothetical protein
MVKIDDHPCTKCELWHNSGLLNNVKYVNIYHNGALFHSCVPLAQAKKLSKKISLVLGKGTYLRNYAGTCKQHLDFTL